MGAVALHVIRRKELVYVVVSLGLLAGTMVYVAQKIDGAFLGAASRFTLTHLTLVIAACALSTLVAALRLQSLAREFGHPLRIGICLRTVAVSQAAANLFFQLYGQLASRSLLLRDQGVPVATTILMTLLERLVGLLMLLALAGTGVTVIFGGVHIDAATGGADLLKIMCGLGLAFGGAIFAWRGLGSQRKHLQNVDGVRLTVTMLRVSVLTAAIQFATLVTFVSSALALAPETDLLALAAASTIVMLASALPISFGGWGVRELGAVFALGAVGVPADAAFLSALTVGIVSLLVTIAVGAACLVVRPRMPAAIEQERVQVDSFNLLAWGLPLLAAVLIFFQVYVPVGNGNINVCLADPLILIGASLFLLNSRTSTRSWRVPHIGALVACCGGVLLVGLVHGWVAFGSNAWAGTKALGWFILVGYALTAALVVRAGGDDGREAVLKTVFAVFLAIACLEYVLFLSRALGFSLPIRSLVRIEGFAQDPNAFAFQCLVVTALLLSRPVASYRAIGLLGTCFAMLWLSGSRSGAIAAVAVVAAAVYFRPRVTGAVGAAAGLAFIVTAFPTILNFAGVSGGPTTSAGMEILGDRQTSSFERWATMRDALWLFLDSPLFGKGLGYFVETHTRADGSRLIIHSSYLWLLAEVGVTGLIAFLLTALVIVGREWRRMPHDFVSRAVILILVGFATMSLVHDLLYQRLLWFALGGLLAFAPAVQREPSR